MADEDRSKWDAKHAAARARPGESTGNEPFLAWASAWLPASGIVLDVACGRGGNAIALARRGLSVDAVDVSLVALGAARDAAQSARVGPQVRTFVADLELGLPLDLPPYDAVLCVHFHQPSLWPALRAALAPGGVLLIETLTTTHADRGNASPSRRFLVPPGELRSAAGDLDVLAFDERDAPETGLPVARLCARRPS